MSASPSLSEAAIFSRIIEADRGDLSPELARHWLALRFASSDQRRVKTLTAKARNASLTAREREELDQYLHAADVLAVMQSRARRVLTDASDE
jgi:hypothetical protein